MILILFTTYVIKYNSKSFILLSSPYIIQKEIHHLIFACSTKNFMNSLRKYMHRFIEIYNLSKEIYMKNNFEFKNK